MFAFLGESKSRRLLCRPLSTPPSLVTVSLGHENAYAVRKA